MTGSFERIEVITGFARRRRWSVDEKRRIVSESLKQGVSVSAATSAESMLAGVSGESVEIILANGCRLRVAADIEASVLHLAGGDAEDGRLITLSVAAGIRIPDYALRSADLRSRYGMGGVRNAPQARRGIMFSRR